MMDLELVAAAKKAITLKSWEWLPGMLGVRSYDSGKADYLQPEVRIQNHKDIEYAKTFEVIPDLTDPATLGCLLCLVRKVSRDPRAYLCDYNGYDSVEWAVCSDVVEIIREELDLKPKGWMRVILGDAHSEGLALAISLEEAEKLYASINQGSKQNL